MRGTTLALLAALASAAHAATPCARGPERRVLMRFAAVAAEAPRGAPGRGELAGWNAMAGMWSGLGSDAGGSFTIKAGVESLFDGQFLLFRTTELRGDAVLRDQLVVWTAGDAAGAYVYDAKAPFRRLTGAVDAAATALSAGDAKLRLTWRQEPDGLAGSREEADAAGALVTTATWALKRAEARSLVERRRDGAKQVAGPVNDFKGELRGEGETPLVPGQGAQEHFQAEESGVVALDDAIVTTRQTHRYDSGRSEQAFLVHGVESDRPFRHAFLARGAVVPFTGEFVGVDQMVFSGPDSLRVTFVHT